MNKGEKERRAMARGEQIRGELLRLLETKPQAAIDLRPQLDPSLDVSQPEVVFQLQRLQEEGDLVTRGQDGVYRLQPEDTR